MSAVLVTSQKLHCSGFVPQKSPLSARDRCRRSDSSKKLLCAVSSEEEHLLDAEGVIGSSPIPRTIFILEKAEISIGPVVQPLFQIPKPGSCCHISWKNQSAPEGFPFQPATRARHQLSNTVHQGVQGSSRSSEWLMQCPAYY